MARGRVARRRRTARRAALRARTTATQTAPVVAEVAAGPDASESVLATLDARRARRLASAEPTIAVDHGTEPTPEEEALARMEEQLAAMPECADCDHAYADHLGRSGPCTAEDCSCTTYAAADVEPDDDEDEAAVPADDFVPSEGLELALRVIGDSPEEAREYVRLRLEEFTVVAAGADDGITLPDVHQPGARVPAHPAPAAVEPPASPGEATAGPYRWNAIFAPEGKLTSDRRAFAPGSITWRELPLTLMAMTKTSEGGHVGAEITGRIDDIWRDEATGLIRGQGVFDDGDFGSEIAELVSDQTLRGVSVDLAISKAEVGPRSDYFDEDGNWAPRADDAADTPSLLDLYSDDTIYVVLAAEIGMVTVCPFPAFAEAKIAVGDSLVAGANPAFVTVTQQAGWTVETCEPCAAMVASAADDDVLTTVEAADEGLTAAAAGLAPVAPSRDWFEDPQLDEATPLTIDDDGRIYGHAASWGVCHIGLPGGCRTAPHSATSYSYFHLGEVVCDDGSRVACGQITLDTGHADRTLGRADATRHYDQTGLVVAHVRVGEDEHGIWVAGALQSDAPAEKVRLLRGAKLSGDWRKVDGNFELVALLAVNVPGFPIPRARALVAAAAGGELEPISLVAAGIPVFEAEIAPEDLERFRALARQAEFDALAEAAA